MESSAGQARAVRWSHNCTFGSDLDRWVRLHRDNRMVQVRADLFFCNRDLIKN